MDGLGFWTKNQTIGMSNWKNNHKEGLSKGKLIDGDTYEWELVNIEVHGFGIYKQPSGNTFEGQYQNNEANGFGIY